jgi:valyl-tRNA synthetase
MNFDMQELNRRPYQVLSTLYHLSRFFLQNAEFDEFSPDRYRFAGNKVLLDRTLIELQPADRWMLSVLQEKIDEYTLKLEQCEFNAAVAILENFVIETLSRLYVPMVRKELWTDDPDTLERRYVIYSLLHHTLRTMTLLFNPITPFLSEALHQKVYRKLDPKLQETINMESWPVPNEKLRDKDFEAQFEVLLKCVSLVYAARQQAKLKRRWPLANAVVVAPEKTLEAIRKAEALFLEQTNVKAVEYAREVPECVGGENWVSAKEDDVFVFVNRQRDETLLGQGIMRDLARRVQALRKELGFVPTEVLDGVHIAELDAESRDLTESYLNEMAGLVRTRKVYLHDDRATVEADWHESELDGKRIYISIH